jgi:hypothetical protein
MAERDERTASRGDVVGFLVSFTAHWHVLHLITNIGLLYSKLYDDIQETTFLWRFCVKAPAEFSLP